MFKKFFIFMFVCFTVLNLCGCIPLMAVMSETAKEKQRINLAYGDTIDAVKAVFKIQEIQFLDARIKPDIAEIVGRCADEKTVRVFVSKISDTESSVSVRVGMTEAGKEDARKIISGITDYASLLGK